MFARFYALLSFVVVVLCSFDACFVLRKQTGMG